MELSTSIKPAFLDLFSNEICCKIPETNCSLNLHILRLENNAFCYGELVRKLQNAIVTFSLSRKQYEEFVTEARYGELYTNAVEKLRDYNINEGEAGEILLYCFLESHLNAPKILTKLEIKTSSQDYVKGSDGIHLLKLTDEKYQLIFGESKLDNNLTTSISNAFKSIDEFINRKKNNLGSEVGLISSQLCKEAFNEDSYQFIKSIIFPSADNKKPITKDNAFAIFAGFEVRLSDDERRLNNDEFRKAITSKIIVEVEKRKNHLKKKIEEHALYGYTFYVYTFPFIEIDKTRKDIIRRLTTIL